MRILNEKHLSLIWSWDDIEKNELAVKYQTNLERLVSAIQDRIGRNEAPPPEDLKDLAAELQQAGELLHQSMQNSFSAAQTLHALAGATPAEQADRRKFIERMKKHIGKPVVLKQTSVDAIRGKQLILEEIRGIKGILRDGDQMWEAMIDVLVPVISFGPAAAKPAPGSLLVVTPMPPPVRK